MRLEPFIATAQERTKKWDLSVDFQDVTLIRESDVSLVRHILTGCEERITLIIVGQGDRAVLADRVQMGYIAGLSQFGEGAISEVLNMATGKYEAKIRLRMCKNAGVDIVSSDDPYLLLENAYAGAKYTLSPQETPFSGTNYWSFNNIQTQSGITRKNVPVAGITALLVPYKPTKLQKFYITFKGGVKPVETTLEELLALNCDRNDMESTLTVFDDTHADQPEVLKSVMGISALSEMVIIDCLGLDTISIDTDGSSFEMVTVQERSRQYQYSL